MIKKFKNWLYKALCAVFGSTPGNFVVGILWFFNALGSTGYLFWIHQPQFAVANLLVSLMLLAMSFVGMPDNK